MPLNPTVKAAYIVAGGTVIAAIIGGLCFLVLGFFSNQNGDSQSLNDPEMETDLPIIVESMEAIPQRVNQKYFNDGLGGNTPVGSKQEISTYRITLKNTGNKSLIISEGEFLVDSVAALDANFNTLVMIYLIDHKGHIEVPVKVPSVGDTITFPVNLPIAPDAHREIICGFRERTATHQRS